MNTNIDKAVFQASAKHRSRLRFCGGVFFGLGLGALQRLVGAGRHVCLGHNRALARAKAGNSRRHFGRNPCKLRLDGPSGGSLIGFNLERIWTRQAGELRRMTTQTETL